MSAWRGWALVAIVYFMNLCPLIAGLAVRELAGCRGECNSLLSETVPQVLFFAVSVAISALIDGAAYLTSARRRNARGSEIIELFSWLAIVGAITCLVFGLLFLFQLQTVPAPFGNLTLWTGVLLGVAVTGSSIMLFMAVHLRRADDHAKEKRVNGH